MSDRILIRGATVLTQDDSLGEMAARRHPGGGRQDRGGRPRTCRADGARVIEADGDIVIPGFVDTHRHTWETSIRTSAPDYTLGAYFGAILDKFAPKYRPDDVYAGNLWGSLECLNAGITTLVDWSHIMNTPEHGDEAVRGLQDARHPIGLCVRLPEHLDPGLVVRHGLRRVSTERINGDEARRCVQYLSDDSGLITMALATRGTNFCKEDVVRYEWELAKELGINITVHVAMDRFGYTKMQLRRPEGDGPALPEHDVHPLVAPARRRVADGRRLRRQRVAGPADRAADGPRLGAGGARLEARHPGRPVVRRGHDCVVRPVHPDARDLRLGAGAPAPGSLGRGPGRQRADARPDRLAPGPALGHDRRRAGGRRRPIGPAPSRPARRPTW